MGRVILNKLGLVVPALLFPKADLQTAGRMQIILMWLSNVGSRVECPASARTRLATRDLQKPLHSKAV